MPQTHGPLQGVKVVSCSTAQAGTVPYMLMADLGADVIKIETPKGGDGSRRMTVLPGKGSTFFETNNRGVKSVTLLTPRLLVSKKVLPLPGRTVMRREPSPPLGVSILITSAPRSAISM